MTPKHAGPASGMAHVAADKVRKLTRHGDETCHPYSVPGYTLLDSGGVISRRHIYIYILILIPSGLIPCDCKRFNKFRSIG